MDGYGNGRPGCHRRGQWAAARQGVGGVDGLLGGHPASLVDAAQVLRDELIQPEKYRQNVRFDALACSVSRYTPVARIPSR
jgi:hypothetical protein